MKLATLAIILLIFTSLTFAQQTKIQSVSLNCSNCINGLAVFLLKNRSNKSIFADVRPAPYWSEWKKTNAQYGTFTAEYKAVETDAFVNVSDRFHELPIFQTILPHATIRYGVPLRKGAGIYRVSVSYIDSLKIRKLFDRIGNLSNEEINQIIWKEVISKDTFVSCKELL